MAGASTATVPTGAVLRLRMGKAGFAVVAGLRVFGCGVVLGAELGGRAGGEVTSVVLSERVGCLVVFLGIGFVDGRRVSNDVYGGEFGTKDVLTKPHSPVERANRPKCVCQHLKPNHIQPKRPNRKSRLTRIKIRISEYQMSKYRIDYTGTA